ncbi:MAG TPA: beta-ketoacyl-ACP synthase II [Chloroflexia bacterium]|nr:beta-ketoacyl-ACP synthase II [Chloroflexia bacterium]
MKNGRRRVVVTGMGAISPLGNDVSTTWQGIVEGRSGIGTITRFDHSRLNTHIAGEVKSFNVEDYVLPKDARRMDRFMHYAIAACKQAAAQANFEVTEENARQTGVMLGSAVGGVETLVDAVVQMHTRGPDRVNPFTIPALLIDLAGSQVAIHMGMKGPNLGMVSACSSSANAIGEAAEIIRQGRARVMFAGGAEAPVCQIGFAAFGVMRVLSTRNDTPEAACRPFDKMRDGFVMSEGAAVVVLEDLDHALERGANIIAEVTGYGTGVDAFHLAAPAEGGEGAQWAMEDALTSAGLQPEDIDYINAHGTGTQANERAETMAIKAAFGDHAYKVPISSTKSMTGHMIGAAGGMEAIFCIKAIQEGIIPPTINYEVPDPECDLDYVPNKARKADVRRAMTNSMGLGGHNAVLIFERFDA